MNFFPKWKSRKKILAEADIARPFQIRARESLLRGDLQKALAYLERGISMAPDHLPLYLERAQIHQYGLANYTHALKDYRHILRQLSEQEGHPLVERCKNGMQDMMTETDRPSATSERSAQQTPAGI